MRELAHLAGVDAAVGVDAGADHGGRDPPGVGVTRVAVGCLNDLHGGLQTFVDVCVVQKQSFIWRRWSNIGSFSSSVITYPLQVAWTAAAGRRGSEAGDHDVFPRRRSAARPADRRDLMK